MVTVAELGECSRAVASTRSRSKKTALLAELLTRLEPAEVRPAIGVLSGEPRQGKLGVGLATLEKAKSAAAASSLDLGSLGLDRAFDELTRLSGKGSETARKVLLGSLFARLSPEDGEFIGRLVLGELRQGALEGVLLEAVAVASKIPPEVLRRALLYAGDITAVAALALGGGQAALEALTVELFRPLRPMLAQSASTIEEAFERARPMAFEQKLDGARIQLHRQGTKVAIFSRHGNELSRALPEIVELVRAFSADEFVLDGEVLALLPDGRPLPFQVTMQRIGRKLAGEELRQRLPLRAFFFDCMYSEKRAWVEATNEERWSALCRIVPESARVVRSVVATSEEALAFRDHALALGHEGVVGKSLASTYEAGRRGSGWIKVKPAPTLDLVVLAAEWGSGRRSGWLSNLHLGARDPEGPGFVMLGKTFKGLTDEMLIWQTQALRALSVEETAQVVKVRPELVVEIAFDGLQRSPIYPGGLALRFARVRGYRPDKSASEADTIDFVRSLHERSWGAGAQAEESADADDHSGG